MHISYIYIHITLSRIVPSVIIHNPVVDFANHPISKSIPETQSQRLEGFIVFGKREKGRKMLNGLGTPRYHSGCERGCEHPRSTL